MLLDSFVDKTLNITKILRSENISACGLYIKDDTNVYVIDLKGENYNLTKDEIIQSEMVYKMK